MTDNIRLQWIDRDGYHELFFHTKDSDAAMSVALSLRKNELIACKEIQIYELDAGELYNVFKWRA